MKKIFISIVALVTLSCNYLDVVPDNITTIEMAFNNRVNANNYLGTCFHFMPFIYDLENTAGMFGADDVAFHIAQVPGAWNYSAAWAYVNGEQNTTRPSFNYMTGDNGQNRYRAINECNTFLKNIDRVPDMTFSEKSRWKAEVLTLKAYYHFWLFIHYGPIALLKDNYDISTSHDGMMLYREKVDDVVDYIVSLLDEAIKMDPGLPESIIAVKAELGRITRSAAMGIKAKVLVYAASPLFNGNEDYAGFIDPRDGRPFFNQEKSKTKWEKAAQACSEAIEEAEKWHSLFKFNDNVQFPLNDETRLQMTLREIVQSRTGQEKIFGPGEAGGDIQRACQPRLTSWQTGIEMNWARGQYAPTLNVVEEYYSKNGVPLEEDKSVDMTKLYDLVTTPDDKPAFFVPNVQTIRLHLDREPRFYANIGFDKGKWFSVESKNMEEAMGLSVKNGEIAGVNQNFTSATGYFAKKIASYQNVNSQTLGLGLTQSSNLHLRLADLYLMYSEALNESLSAPNNDVYKYIQMVRHRAGLDVGGTLQETWAAHSNRPNKPLSQDGMREIIRRERLIELQFEGWRLHDIRRWKAANEYLNKPIRGLDIYQTQDKDFYKPVVVYNRAFALRDYLWPIQRDNLLKNTNLVQNPFWK